MTDRPNILFISSDSMDGRAMGCTGHPAAHTPHMDRLAERGVLFTHTYCNSPQCCPSRASMWSGRYVHQEEAWNNHKGLEAGAPTFQMGIARRNEPGRGSGFDVPGAAPATLAQQHGQVA